MHRHHIPDPCMTTFYARPVDTYDFCLAPSFEDIFVQSRDSFFSSFGRVRELKATPLFGSSNEGTSILVLPFWLNSCLAMNKLEFLLRSTSNEAKRLPCSVKDIQFFFFFFWF